MNAAASVDEVVGALDADGYAIVEGLLSPGEAASARAELTRLLAAIPEGRNPFEGFNTRRIYALFAKTRCLDGPATHPVVLGVLDRVLGPFQLSAPTGIEIGPGEVAQSLHHDDGVYPLTRPHPEVVANVMWALDDFTEANGATRVVAGSHRWVEDRPDASTATTIGGDAGGVGDALRREPLARWRREHDRPAAPGRRSRVRRFVVAAPGDAVARGAAAVVRQLPERLQELLGYNVYPPFLGYVDGRHPRRLLEVDTDE